MPSIVTVLIWSAAFLDQALLLIVFFALLTPLRRLILATLLFLVAFFLSLMNSSTVMLRRAIDCHKLQGLGLRCVDELMLSAGGYHNNVGSFDVL